MRLSQKFPIPSELALLYEFVNSVDLRRFVEQGVPHEADDAFATVPQLEAWLRRRGLLARAVRLGQKDHREALDLRHALRVFLQLAPADRPAAVDAAALFNASAARFPLIVHLHRTGRIQLHPAPRRPSSGLGTILAELHHAAETDKLGRLKMCASEDCRWIFFDRSKPASRRWCSSVLCGNRQKTRTYRQRQRERRPPSEDP
jgi:predicted RNA-binding Zn ribbon-like protein